MTKTKYYDLQMDDPQDDYDVEVVNANLKRIDEQMKTRENATDALQEPEFTVADKRENIASKEKMPKILGKIAKFFTDLKTVAFSGKYSDLDGKPAIVNNNTATEAGSALDARQANPTIEGTMANQILQLNNDLNDHLYGFRWRKFINTWTSASQIDSGCGIYNIGEISSDYWSSICKNEKLQNVGDYVLIIFQWNGTESALRFSVGLLISCRMSNLIYVTVWNGEFNLT
mgnify:FL=1|jgi:hypothetical protein